MAAARNKTCFFLRGLVRESAHWSGFLESFQKRFPEWKVVPLDLPGCGNRYQEICPNTISEIVEILRKEFLQKKSEENYFFAISLGAMVGIHWMQKYEKDFQGAVLGNTSVRGINPLYHRLKPKQWGKILSLFFQKDPVLIERTILEITSENRSRFAELEQSWAQLQQQRPVSKKNALRQLWAAATYAPDPMAPSTPILLVNGDKDDLVSPLCSLNLANQWRVPLKIHPNAGHDITLDEPEWVLEQMDEFFLAKKSVNK